MLCGKGDQGLRGRKKLVLKLVKVREMLKPSWSLLNFIIKFEIINNMLIRLYHFVLKKCTRNGILFSTNQIALSQLR